MAKAAEDLARRALDVPRLTIGQLADAAGVSRPALVSYQQGRAPMPWPARARLAAFLEAHAMRLLALAEELRTGGD